MSIDCEIISVIWSQYCFQLWSDIKNLFGATLPSMCLVFEKCSLLYLDNDQHLYLFILYQGLTYLQSSHQYLEVAICYIIFFVPVTLKNPAAFPPFLEASMAIQSASHLHIWLQLACSFLKGRGEGLSFKCRLSLAIIGWERTGKLLIGDLQCDLKPRNLMAIWAHKDNVYMQGWGGKERDIELQQLHLY